LLSGELRWIKKSGLDSPQLSHLKRVRNKAGKSSLLLGRSSDALPLLPVDLNLSDPYIVEVPRTAGLTVTSVQLKSLLWPTIYAPRRRGEFEAWSRGKVRWAWESMKHVVDATAKAKADGEVGPVLMLRVYLIDVLFLRCR
jgi:tRNA-specific adenosine deaminase 3